MKSKINPKAIFFDMDGVLVNSLDSWWKSLNAALKNYNVKEISREEFIEKFWGYELQENLRKLGLNKEIVTFCNNIYSVYTGEIKIFSKVKETLKKLDNYKKAVITNTPKDCALQILKKFDIKKFFNIIVTSDQIKKGKPAPDMIYKACQELKIQPREVVLVGDTESDVKAGRAAGCKIIGINIDADFSIKTFSELLNIIEN